MAIVIEHEKRRHEILQKSLDVFIDEGYDDVTFQKIADKCGITRTTLYIYFKNKQEIFLWSIKQFLGGVESAIQQVVDDESITAETSLRKMLEVLIDAIEENHKLIKVLQIYLLQLEKSGVSINDKIKHRVIRIRHILNHILITGIRNKEFKEMNVTATNEFIYSLIESAMFRVSVLSQEKITEVRDVFKIAVDGLLV